MPYLTPLQDLQWQASQSIHDSRDRLQRVKTLQENAGAYLPAITSYRHDLDAGLPLHSSDNFVSRTLHRARRLATDTREGEHAYDILSVEEIHAELEPIFRETIDIKNLAQQRVDILTKRLALLKKQLAAASSLLDASSQANSKNKHALADLDKLLARLRKKRQLSPNAY